MASKKRFYLLIDTSEYTGNFNRELCSYVFGAYCDAQDWVTALRESFQKETGKVGEDISESLHNFYDEHGETVCEIYKENCLKVFFDEDPTPFMDVIMERLKKFPKALAASWEFSPKRVKIKRVTLFSESSQDEVEWVKKVC